MIDKIKSKWLFVFPQYFGCFHCLSCVQNYTELTEERRHIKVWSITVSWNTLVGSAAGRVTQENFQRCGSATGNSYKLALPLSQKYWEEVLLW